MRHGDDYLLIRDINGVIQIGSGLVRLDTEQNVQTAGILWHRSFGGPLYTGLCRGERHLWQVQGFIQAIDDAVLSNHRGNADVRLEVVEGLCHAREFDTVDRVFPTVSSFFMDQRG